MLTLTQEERRVILFLIGMALVGLGINFALKVNSGVKKFIKVDNSVVKIDINKVAYEDLLDIQGITPKLAKKIIEYRDTYGPFRELQDLKEIKGIGDYRYERLKELFFVE